MNRIYYLFILLLFAACEEHGKTSVDLKAKFDSIDKITGVDNWKWIDGSDTSYLYFSRINDQKINIYHFNIIKGDSVNTQLNSIKAKYDSIKWDWRNKQWDLISANDSVMEWAEKGENGHFIFKKLDRMHISLTSPTGRIDTLSKTLPLATFLVRVKYDYEHGTSYLDSSLVPPRRTKKIN